MCEAYVAAGLPPARFWEITPRLYHTEMNGAVERLKREHNERAWLAWHIEALARQKRMPKLKDLLHGAGPANRKMTPEQIEAVTRSWLASRHRKR